MGRLAVVVAGIVLLVAIVVAVSLGRYTVSVPHVLQILASGVLPDGGVTDTERTVVELVRLPRVMLAVLVGGGLGVAGAALQATFRNPLVSPDIIGVSSGASFGGACGAAVLASARRSSSPARSCSDSSHLASCSRSRPAEPRRCSWWCSVVSYSVRSSPHWSGWCNISPTLIRRCPRSCSGCSAASPQPPGRRSSWPWCRSCSARRLSCCFAGASTCSR